MLHNFSKFSSLVTLSKFAIFNSSFHVFLEIYIKNRFQNLNKGCSEVEENLHFRVKKELVLLWPNQQRTCSAHTTVLRSTGLLGFPWQNPGSAIHPDSWQCFRHFSTDWSHDWTQLSNANAKAEEYSFCEGLRMINYSKRFCFCSSWTLNWLPQMT